MWPFTNRQPDKSNASEDQQPLLSCFVLGLIKSMKEQPDGWSTSCGCYCLDLVHKASSMRMWYYTFAHGHPCEILTMSEDMHKQLTASEMTLLMSTIREVFIDGPSRAKVAAMKQPFEQLGCPPTQL